jgi:hypothetical protein
MIDKYGSAITLLEREASSQNFAIPLLFFTNISMILLAIATQYLTTGTVVLLAIFPGSILSLWQLQILHDNIHGSLLNKSMTHMGPISKKTLQHWILFWGSMPSIFGYYLYLKYGHMSHHRNVGDDQRATLAQLFSSDQMEFEDGDVLFVSHRMKLKGEIGPTINLPWNYSITLSISRSAFSFWRVRDW